MSYKNDTHDIDIGPTDPSEGEVIEIVRCFQTRDDPTEGELTVITYKCQGVVDMDVQDPWQMGSNEPKSMIGLTFCTGRREYVEGVITDVGNLNDDA